MRRGLPANDAGGRAPRARRAVSPPRARASSSRGSSAPWWHHAVLWIAMLASAPLVSMNLPAGGNRDYELARAGAIALCAFLTLWLSYRVALRFASPGAALPATIAIWLASSLPVYLYLLPSLAETAAMFSAALFLTLWLSIRDGRDSSTRWVVFGLAGGLAISVSAFNAAFLVVAIVECLTRLFRPRAFVRGLTDGLWFLAGGAAAVGAALAVHHQMFGAWLTSGLGPIVNWRHPELAARVFFAASTAYVWTPVLVVAAAGLLVAIRRQPVAGFTLLVAAALFFSLVAAYGGPAGASFGGRQLIPLTPILVCGLSALIDAIVGSRGRVAWAATATAMLALVFWNAGLIVQWRAGLVPAHGPNLRDVAARQVSAVPRAAKGLVIRYAREWKGLRG